MVGAPGVWLFDVSHLERLKMNIRKFLELAALAAGLGFTSCIGLGCAAKGNVSGSFGQERILSGSYAVVYDASLEVPILDELIAVVLPPSTPTTPDP